MTVSLVILATMFLIGSHSVFGADGNAKPVDEEFLRGYMAGEYDLIGRKADSDANYTGHVTLRDNGGVLQVTRTVDGRTDKRAAPLANVAGATRIPALRLHF